jgi:hypothetical protein
VTSVLRSARSWATATVETVAVFLATAVILFPGATALGTALGLPSGVVHVAIQIVAFGATYAFVAGEWSIGTLGEYFFAFLAATSIVLGLTGTVPTFEGINLSVGDSIVRLGLWCLVYVVAGGAVTSGVSERVPGW